MESSLRRWYHRATSCGKRKRRIKRKEGGTSVLLMKEIKKTFSAIFVYYSIISSDRKDHSFDYYCHFSMPSRSPRSRSRSRSRKHKKSRKRSRRSSDERSPSPVKSVKKEEQMSNETDANSSVYKARLPSVMLPPAFLAKLDNKDDEKSKSPIGDQSPADTNSTAPSTQTTRVRKKRFADEADRVFLPGMPTNISATNMTDQQQKIYIRTLTIHRTKSNFYFSFFSLCFLVQVQIEELTRRLKLNDLGIPTNAEAR